MNSDKLVFERVFRKYFGALRNVALGIVKDRALAEGIVQEIFLKLWDSKRMLKEEDSIFPYLISSTRNKCIDHIRHKAVEQKYIDLSLWDIKNNTVDNSELTEDVVKDVNEAVRQLPPKCRQVFKLSRFDNLSHKEIALELGISTKTVENHITKAISLLKLTLSKYNKNSTRMNKGLDKLNRG